jgi:hypothetical protein
MCLQIQEKTGTARYGTYRDVSLLHQSLFLDITAPSRSSCPSQYEIFSTIFCSLPVARLSPYVFIDTFKLELLPYKFELLCPIFSSWHTDSLQITGQHLHVHVLYSTAFSTKIMCSIHYTEFNFEIMCSIHLTDQFSDNMQHPLHRIHF